MSSSHLSTIGSLDLPIIIHGMSGFPFP
jgi:hypothetical protein